MAADIVVTAAKVGVVFPDRAEIYDFVAGVAITAGQLVYLDSAGKLGVADANGSGTTQAKGVALNAAGVGQAVSVMKRGHIFGFTLTALAYDALVYISATAGAFYDGAAGINAAVGRVVSMPDGDLTKVIYVDFPWTPVLA